MNVRYRFVALLLLPLALGAAVAPEQFKPSAPPPEDFDEFWKGKLAELSSVRPNPKLTPKDSGKPGVDYWHVTLDNIRGTHVRGQLVRPTDGDKHPALLIVQWAGVYPLEKHWAIDRAEGGWLVLNISAHDIPIDEPAEFYKRQLDGPLKEYWSIGNDDRETAYFLRMYLSCYRAADYLANRPDWDGKTLVVLGDSQGGQQSLVTAALYPKVTAAIAGIPAGCDMLGPDVGRRGGWPQWYQNTQSKDAAKVRNASRYFDVVNFAASIECPVLIGAGLSDDVCPPEGILAAANQIKSPKEVILMPGAGHQEVNGDHAPYKKRCWEVWLPMLQQGKPAAGETTMSEPFLLGVNYWPRRKAMYWWADFDAGEVREEFAMIRDLGLTHVRFFLLWESFQPSPEIVSTTALADLRTVCDIAAEIGLLLQPTFFTGHMSGPNWCPDWLLDPKTPRRDDERQLVSLSRRTGSTQTIYNIYTTPFVIEAEDLLLRTVCGELKDHPAIWGYSLGNEPDLFCKPPTAQHGKQWVRDRVRTIRGADPNHLALIGLHNANLDYDVGLRVDHIAAETDVSVMHGYSIYNRLAREPLDPDYVPFTCALTAALAGRPVLYEEFGVNTQWPDGPSRWSDEPTWNGKTRRTYFASEDDAAAYYYAAVLPRLHRVGALSAFCWCFPDYHESLWNRPPCDFQRHERWFGLWRPDASLKPMGRVVADFAKTGPTVRTPEKTVTLPVTPDEYYREPSRYLPSLYAHFGKLGRSST